MSWIGAGIGALLGAQRGSILGGIIGAVIGNWVEGKVRNFVGASDGNASSGGNASASPNELATLAAISAMLAKLAKADGRITVDEVRYCEQVFDRLGLHGEKREYCIRVFRTAKSDSHSIYEYAASFASAQPGAQIREIVYGILWDLACVDGVVSPEEVAGSILVRLGEPSARRVCRRGRRIGTVGTGSIRGAGVFPERYGRRTAARLSRKGQATASRCASRTGTVRRVGLSCERTDGASERGLGHPPPEKAAVTPSDIPENQMTLAFR